MLFLRSILCNTGLAGSSGVITMFQSNSESKKCWESRDHAFDLAGFVSASISVSTILECWVSFTIAGSVSSGTQSLYTSLPFRSSSPDPRPVLTSRCRSWSLAFGLSLSLCLNLGLETKRLGSVSRPECWSRLRSAD